MSADMEKEVKVKIPTFIVDKTRPDSAITRRRKVGTTARKQLVNDVITEVGGFAPYEKRVIELLKIDNVAASKRALKFCKKRLGSHARALKKRKLLSDVVAAQKKH